MIKFIFPVLFYCSMCFLLTPEAKTHRLNPDSTTMHTPKDTIKTDSQAYKNYLVGKIDYTQDLRFVLVDHQYSNKEIYLRKETYAAFLKMHRAAKEDGVNLYIVSGGRNFDYQKGIWERKWKNLKNLTPLEKAKNILAYSSMPMTSRHHWGTDMDLNHLTNSYFDSGEGLAIYTWLREHASQYGFCQVYTDKTISGRTGYEMEKWHWSYMPLADQMLKDYNRVVKPEDIKGFTGSELATEIGMIENYVNGITHCSYTTP